MAERPERQVYTREPAKRVFAQEFRATKFVEKFDDTDDKAPTYALTPTGGVVNRVFIAGVLTSKEKNDEGGIRYRGTVFDGTGVFYLMVGSFQPDAMLKMAKIKDPCFVAIVGKPSVFTTEDKRVYTSVRVEDIAVVDKTVRALWVLDTAQETLDRIANMERGADSFVNEIRGRYNTDTKVYRAMVRTALENLIKAEKQE